jgi:hypothetical protein
MKKVFIDRGEEETGKTEKKTGRIYRASICDGTSRY